MKTVYERWREVKAESQALYEAITATDGRVTVGPSNTVGVYIKATPNASSMSAPDVMISNLTEAEARFIAGHFAKVFGWE